jgi:high affinity Mn2+ porin
MALSLHVFGLLRIDRPARAEAPLPATLFRPQCVLVLLLLSAGHPAAAAGSPSPNFDWTGWYFGADGGYGLGNGPMKLSDPAATRSKGSFASLLGGMHAGYRRLFPTGVLVGVETDVSFPYFLHDDDTTDVAFAQLLHNEDTAAIFETSRSTVALKMDSLGRLRGDVGYAFDRFLVYATGGVAWSLSHFSETPGVARGEDDAWDLRPGWAVGAGAEVALSPDWTVRIEYVHDQFAPMTAVLPSGVSASSTQGVHSLMLALAWRFRGPGDCAPTQKNAATSPPEPGSWSVHGQSTLVEQGYPSFHSPYEGMQSLSGKSQARETTSATVFLGVQLWQGAQLYFNPELMQGFGLSKTVGVAAFPNGEAQRASYLVPRFDVSRLFVTQTFGFGGEKERVEEAPNQIAGERDISRLSITVGRFGVTDFFTVNPYAGEPRTTFLNWNVYGPGAYDWAMDLPSYDWGGLVDLNQKHWAIRAGYVLVPLVSNTNYFDMEIPSHGQVMAELELRYSPFSRPGKLKLFGWWQRANMGSYDEAVAEPNGTPRYPDITLTRQIRTNYGFLIGAEQAITDDLGVFSRASWNPGQVEMMGWTDCDESFSLGATMNGTLWGRPSDTVGAAGLVEGLSRAAIAYFSDGGLGILIGDGRLNYRQEIAVEAYYSFSPFEWVAATFDYQLIVDPGYNADRGPVSIFALRIHTAF